MEPWLVFLIILGVAVFVIIIASVNRRNRKKKPKQEIQSFVNFGDYVSAGAMHLKQKREKEAADLYFQSPPEKRPAYEAMVAQRLGKQGSQLFWIKTGRRFERVNPENARINPTIKAEFSNSDIKKIELITKIVPLTSKIAETTKLNA